MKITEAQKLVEDKVLSKVDNCAILADSTIEYDFGWAFFYQSRDYIESKDFRKMVVGHGPVLVDRGSGKYFETGSAHPVEHYVNAYICSGDPLSEPTENIEVSSWKEGANKVEATKYIKEVSGLGLKESKNIVDQALSNNATTFSVNSPRQAQEVVKILSDYNFICRQLWSNQC